MNAYFRFEILAAAFETMTGTQAPGKDAAAESYPEPLSARIVAWEHWNQQHKQLIEAMLKAVDNVKPEFKEE